MKIQTTTVMAVLATGLVLALNPSVRAADTNTPPAKSMENHGGGGGGQRFTPEARLERMDQTLHLTADQKPKVLALLQAQTKDMQGFRDLSPDERQAKGKEMHEKMGKSLKPILTEEQYKAWEAMPPMRGGRPGASGDHHPDAPKADAPKS